MTQQLKFMFISDFAQIKLSTYERNCHYGTHKHTHTSRGTFYGTRYNILFHSTTLSKSYSTNRAYFACQLAINLAQFILPLTLNNLYNS